MSENNTLNTITTRLADTLNNIKLLEQKHQRADNTVKLMAVSKTKPVSDIIDAYQSGHRLFGENYVQELAQKATELANYQNIEWHYIGPIQSNKTALIAQHAHWVDSLDRIKIAKRLQQHCLEMDKRLQILVQVNISQRPEKSGILLNDVEDFVKELNQFDRLQFRGLMAIPHQYSDLNQLEKEFSALNHCFLSLQAQYPQVDTLSIGMSQDIESAIKCGSTMVRVGTAIFGQREAK